MKYKAPEDMTSFSHGGVEMEIPANGEVDVPETANADIVAAMLSHGFTVVEEKKQGRRKAEA